MERCSDMKRQRWKILILGCVLIFLLYCFYAFLSSYCMLSVSSYVIKTDKIDEKVRIVHISDLHNAEFGEDNNRLSDIVREQMPDFIVITGDLLNSDEISFGIAVNLISKLSEIAPVYVSMGNHEIEFESKNAVDLSTVFTGAGATVLDEIYLDVILNNQDIRLGGIYGYCLPKDSEAARGTETAFLEDFQDTNSFKILLTHMPLAWYYSGSLEYWDVDCVFTGHTHGGQVRLPFIGGLWAPDRGWFPGKEEGLYYSDDRSKVMVLSRGLGSAEKIPRFNNIPEVVVVDIVPTISD